MVRCASLVGLSASAGVCRLGAARALACCWCRCVPSGPDLLGVRFGARRLIDGPLRFVGGVVGQRGREPVAAHGPLRPEINCLVRQGHATGQFRIFMAAASRFTRHRFSTSMVRPGIAMTGAQGAISGNPMNPDAGADIAGSDARFSAGRLIDGVVITRCAGHGPSSRLRTPPRRRLQGTATIRPVQDGSPAKQVW